MIVFHFQLLDQLRGGSLVCGDRSLQNAEHFGRLLYRGWLLAGSRGRCIAQLATHELLADPPSELHTFPIEALDAGASLARG